MAGRSTQPLGSMRYSVVPINEGHVTGFHAALDYVARERSYLAFLEAPPLEETRKFVLENLKNNNPAYVAIAEQTVAGWCDVIRIPRDTLRHCGMLGIALLPAFRGAGLGRQLMEATITAAWDRDFTRIELTVREDNVRAIALYKRLGFELEGVRRNGFRVDGQYRNVLSMALLKDHAA